MVRIFDLNLDSNWNISIHIILIVEIESRKGVIITSLRHRGLAVKSLEDKILLNKLVLPT
jgi:hypothetical protein